MIRFKQFIKIQYKWINIYVCVDVRKEQMIGLDNDSVRTEKENCLMGSNK